MRGDDEYKMRNLTFSEQEWKQQQYQDHIQQKFCLRGKCKTKNIHSFTMNERPTSRGYGTHKKCKRMFAKKKLNEIPSRVIAV